MNAYIIYNKSAYEKNKRFARYLADAADKKGLTARILFAEDITYGVKNNEPYFLLGGEKLEKGIFINRTRDFILAAHIELSGQKVYNSSYVNMTANNKLLSYQAAVRLGVPVADTEFVTNGVRSAQTGKYVIKPAGGHGGEGVTMRSGHIAGLIRTTAGGAGRQGEVSRSAVERGGLFAVQPFVDIIGDVRVYIAGNKIVTALIRKPEKDFRANYGINGAAAVFDIPPALLAHVKKFTDNFTLSLVGLDFFYTREGKFLFNEMEDPVGCKAVYELTDINIAEMFMREVI